jgi:hypothetical protein
MNFRRSRPGFGVALSAVCFCFALSSSLAAQEDADRETKAAQPDPDSPAGDAPPRTDPDDQGDAQKGADAEADKAPPTSADAQKPLATAPPDPAHQEVAAAAGIERVPGSGYPEPRVRGIKGGSLWLTMHGLQWPYLPAINGKPALRLGISGSIWSDGSYARILSGSKGASGQPDPPHQKRWANQSRAVLRASPTYSTESGWFAQGQAELVALGDQQFNSSTGLMGFTDDLYVRAGKWNLFDVTAGRFQGWEIANHYGMGLDLNTLEREGANIQTASIHPEAAYGLTYFWDRADARLGSYAIHVYPTDYVRVEVLGQVGAGSVGFNAVQANVRPSAILDLGFLKVKGGLEYGKADQQADRINGSRSRSGFGVAVQGVFDPYVEAGVGLARGFEDHVDQLTNKRNDASSNTVTGVSGFLNARIYGPLIIGGGALYSHWVNLTKDLRQASPHFGEYDFDRQLQTFGALQYSAWDMFYVKAVGAYAHWRHQDRSSTPFANRMMSGRLRLMVLF